MIESEKKTDQDKEARRKQIVEELARLKQEGIGDSSENEKKFQRIKSLEAELFEIDPPPGI